MEFAVYPSRPFRALELRRPPSQLGPGGLPGIQLGSVSHSSTVACGSLYDTGYRRTPLERWLGDLAPGSNRITTIGQRRSGFPGLPRSCYGPDPSRGRKFWRSLAHLLSGPCPRLLVDRGTGRFQDAAGTRSVKAIQNTDAPRALFLLAALSDDAAQGVSEYAVVMSMVVLLALLGVSLLSTQALDTLRKVAGALH
jgi:hypothetical protein